MEIRICGYIAASLLLEQAPKQWHVLAMLDSGKRPTDFVEDHALSHLFLYFDDVEQPLPNKLPPTSAMVERGLAFASGKDKLLVTCRAGRGRSVAMAYLIRCQDRGADDAIQLLDPTRHRPNRLVIALGDGLLGDPNILDRFEDWQRRNAGIQLSDYYDQMEREFEALEAQGAVNRICGP